MTKEITALTACRLAEALHKRQISAEEAAESYLRRIEEKEPEIGAYLTVTADRALQRARAVDKKRLAGETLPTLAGVPAGLKDNI
jgi:Asp-tRNA(Asn)/Glu-tRNA(Gln) amidotransferase A subunit family amidase